MAFKKSRFYCYWHSRGAEGGSTVRKAEGGGTVRKAEGGGTVKRAEAGGTVRRAEGRLAHKIHNSIIIALRMALELRATAAYQFTS